MKKERERKKVKTSAWSEKSALKEEREKRRVKKIRRREAIKRGTKSDTIIASAEASARESYSESDGDGDGGGEGELR